MQLVRELTKIRNKYLFDTEGPRRSKKWYLSHLDRGTSVDKQLNKLPLTKEFLCRYAEDVSDYQIRRITNTLIKVGGGEIARWVLLRQSGLSDERLTEITEAFLKDLLPVNGWSNLYFLGFKGRA